jgi:polyphosphate kinase
MQFARDLSWLGFNLRVLEEATDNQLDIFERMKFISIFSSNLDEFFRVRYPSVIALSGLNQKTRTKASIEMSSDIAEKIQNEVNRQLELSGNILTQQIIPELKNNKINFYYNSPIRKEHLREMKEIFLSNILAFIQPIFLESDSSFLPENNKLYFVVTIKDTTSNILKQAIVNIPSDKIKRFFVLTPIDGEEYVIFIDDIIP